MLALFHISCFLPGYDSHDSGIATIVIVLAVLVALFGGYFVWHQCYCWCYKRPRPLDCQRTYTHKQDGKQAQPQQRRVPSHKKYDPAPVTFERAEASLGYSYHK